MRVSKAGAPVAWTIASLLLTSCGGSTTPSTSIAGQQNQSRTIKRGTTSCPCLYVTNWQGQSITVYPTGASGNVQPIQTIAGAATGIDLPYDVALDASDNIYVTNFDNNSITIYAAGATGDVAPIGRISGSNTDLLDPEGIGIDPINGNIEVLSLNGPSGSPSILIFPPGSNGNVAPSEVIEGSKTGLGDPVFLALDASGNIYDSDVNSYVDVYAAGSTGNVRPMRKIKGGLTKLAIPLGLTLDSSSNLYVANNEKSSVTVYAPEANGNVGPIQFIKGGKTKLDDVHDVAVDGSDTIYASNGAGEPRCTTCSFVAVYASGATGNAAPVKVIKGRKTGLDGPAGMTIH